MPTREFVQAEVTFLTTSEGGRQQAPSLSTNQYRPHIVVGDPSQRRAIVDATNTCSEKYCGVQFERASSEVRLGEPIVTTMRLMYSPHEMYDDLQPGVTFTVREGPVVVAFGHILKRWQEAQ